ncbi:MAG: endo-1,4-beta-xylanase [Bacteroidia bacterium]
MKKIAFLILALGLCSSLAAQDTYHTQLQDSLQINNSLPAGNWLFYDNEANIMSNAGAYGTSSSSVQTATGQMFSQQIEHVMANAGNAPWDAGWNIRNTSAVQAGDVLLAVFYIRSVGGEGKVNFFVENTTTYAKEVILTLPVGTDWRRYYIPFTSGANYAPNNLGVGLHLAFQAQTIQIGGFTALNYANTTSEASLPNEINNQFYGGWEANAPWRAEAATRIDSLRKADLLITIKDNNGDPLPNAAVEVKMLKHDFAFGSAVTADKLPGSNRENIIYYNKIIDLDGEGHGFNWVVFENDMKWNAWEDEWFVNKTELVNSVSWLRSNDISIRGHVLLWPGNNNMPSDIYSNLGDLPYIDNRIDQHFNTILNYPGLAGEISEWDVINETITNTTLENAFAGNPGYTSGREYYGEVFQKAHDEDSTIGLWLNDYVTLSVGNEAGSAQYEELKRNLGEIVNSGAPIDGIGFQGHIGGFPNGIPSVLATYDDFYNAYGLKAKVTEFDLPPIVNEELGADYLRDFMTATFSHPSMNGFLFWNFWDGSTWQNPGANLFRQDWSLSEPGQAFIDVVFDEWWTEETAMTQADGTATVKGFKGQYEIYYVCDGQTIRDTLNLIEAQTYEIVCNNVSTSLTTIAKADIQVYPNPSNGKITINSTQLQNADIRIYDLHGREVRFFEQKNIPVQLDLELPKGVYFIELRQQEKRGTYKLVIQ